MRSKTLIVNFSIKLYTSQRSFTEWKKPQLNHQSQIFNEIFVKNVANKNIHQQPEGYIAFNKEQSCSDKRSKRIDINIFFQKSAKYINV